VFSTIEEEVFASEKEIYLQGTLQRSVEETKEPKKSSKFDADHQECIPSDLSPETVTSIFNKIFEQPITIWHLV